jgi:hypothetical protein
MANSKKKLNRTPEHKPNRSMQPGISNFFGWVNPQQHSNAPLPETAVGRYGISHIEFP